MIQRQFKQRLLAAQLRGPVIELTLHFTLGQPLPLPLRIIGVMHRQCRVIRQLAKATGLVAADKLARHHIH
ncbi:hypothetical protein D3C78_1231160 [compost metagenome]